MNCRDIEELEPLYLSREIEQSQRGLFEAHLAECRSCRGKISQQAAMDAQLRDALLADVPDTAAIQQAVRARIAATQSLWWTMAVAAAAVLVAVFVGYQVLKSPPKLYTDAALDHRLEVMEHQPRRWRTDPAELQKFAVRFSLANLDAIAPPGYRLEHAKMCRIDGQPALHLVYTNGAQEYSVFVKARAGNAAKNVFRTASVGSEHLASFQTDRLEAVIASAGSSSECLQFARVAASVL